MTQQKEKRKPAAGKAQGTDRATSGGGLGQGREVFGGQVKKIQVPMDNALEEGAQEHLRPIMLVDDDLDFLRLAKSALERNGFEVDARPDAPKWQDLQRVHPAVVFMDIELGGENGVDICHAMKTSGRAAHVPVILISGHGEERLKDEASRCHADGFLSKPFNSDLLVKLAKHYSTLS